MALDKWIAALFLVGAVIYGYAAFTYPLLPFERNASFLPSTLPMGLAVAAAVLSIVILVTPKVREDGEALGDVDLEKLRDYRFDQAAMLIGAMILYALALRPIGFVASTTVFLVGTGYILGERKFHIMIPVALAGAGVVWFLVQETLGIFLKPLPWFLD
ncbi:MAG: tripartite tricarboxylate transporter TctB family protein [Pseudomonadota bacterium]